MDPEKQNEGDKVNEAEVSSTSQFNNPVAGNGTEAETSSATSSDTSSAKTGDGSEATGDISSHKMIATIGYVLPFLFFLPLIDDKAKSNEYARFHSNQQLVLLILIVGVQFVHGMLLMSLGALGYLIMNILSVALLVLVIIGAINAHKGKMKELPLIGHFRLMK